MQSMTGCGTGRAAGDGWEVTAELRTVNHRFLDVGLKLPRNLSFLEKTIRDGLAQGLKRGHADIYVTVRNTETGARRVLVDEALAKSYLTAAETLKPLGLQDDLTLSRLMQMDGVVTLEETDMNQELVSALCSEAVTQAVTQVNKMRAEEGLNLQADLSVHLDAAAALREKILARAPETVTEYREKLQARLNTLVTDGVDPVRLTQEVAIMADRCAIDEELARLESHIRQMRAYLNVQGEIGKKMDFLIQEMNREANTIGSKASDAEIAQVVVDLKSEIEKLREQIQNVE